MNTHLSASSKLKNWIRRTKPVYSHVEKIFCHDGGEWCSAQCGSWNPLTTNKMTRRIKNGGARKCVLLTKGELISFYKIPVVVAERRDIQCSSVWVGGLKFLKPFSRPAPLHLGPANHDASSKPLLHYRCLYSDSWASPSSSSSSWTFFFVSLALCSMMWEKINFSSAFFLERERE